MSLLKSVYSILRYHNLIGNNFKITDKLNFGNEENIFFIKALKKSNFFLEYGSGASTLVAQKNNIECLSVEADRGFYIYIKRYCKNIRLQSLGYVYHYSHPIFFVIRKYFLAKKAKKMCSEPLEHLIKIKKFPDLILIDGRYRVLCGLFLYKYLLKKNKKFTLIVDDYKSRYRYHILAKFFKIRTIGRFGVSSQLIDADLNEVDAWIEHFSLVKR